MKRKDDVIGFLTIFACMLILNACSSDDEDTKCAMNLVDYGDGVCRPKDPCSADKSCAAENRKCVNKQGTAECGDCLAGYHKEASTCVKDKKCGSNTCSNHGTCDDSAGIPTCRCKNGYAGDNCETCAQGYTDYGDGACRPNDPCNPNPCTEDYETQCTNDQGKAICSCDQGYELNHLGMCVRFEYQCEEGHVCGANAWRRECRGKTCGTWSVLQPCNSKQVCWANQQGAGCTTCELGCLDGVCQGCPLGSGPCCDDKGQIKPNTIVCDQGYNYRCAGTECGDDVQKQPWTKYCNGQTPKCLSEPVLGDWELERDCQEAALCQKQEGAVPTCSLCEHGCSTGACLDCSEGACCDANGHFKDTQAQCAQGTNYRCAGTGCGDDVQKQNWIRYCNGEGADCVTEPVLGTWELENDCPDTALCQGRQGAAPTCSLCKHGCDTGECLDCSEGICCGSDGRFKGNDSQCDWWTEYECLETCGTNRQYRVVTKNCSGTSNACEGEVFEPVWEPMASCDDDETCELDSNGVAQCVYCGDYSTCVEGICTCDFESCIEVCCEEGQICHWTDTCGNGETKILANDANRLNEFGTSVSISGDWTLVGAPRGNGGAYFFHHENGEWIQKQKLIASDSEYWDSFGQSVSISGNVAIVGAYRDGDEEDSPIDAGAAYIFQLENGVWVEKKKLTASDPQSYDYFGYAVSIDGNIAIVGAYHEEGIIGDPSIGDDEPGAAYIFQLEDGEWVEKQKLTASDAQRGDWFGHSVSISGEVAIVGADREEAESQDVNRNSGAAYVFQLENGIWVEKVKLTVTAPEYQNYFARALSISGEWIIVGSKRNIYFFQLVEGNWVKKTNKQTSFNSVSVSISGEMAISGHAGGAETDTAYIYRLENGEWVTKARLTASDGKTWDDFGKSVSISENVAFVGAPREDGGDWDPLQDAGAIYIY